MNQESEPNSQSPNRRETSPAEHVGIKDLFIATVADNAPTRRERSRILNGYFEHGTPFALYLGLDGVDPYAETVVADFLINYDGCYASKQHLMDQTLEDLGLKDEVEKFIDSHTEVAGLLSWDWEVLWDLLQERWEIIDVRGVLYVFER